MDEENSDIIKKAIKFKRKPAKTGKRYVINLPSIYMENGVINPEITYTIYMVSNEKEKDKKKDKKLVNS
jgi:hypothetical protein